MVETIDNLKVVTEITVSSGVLSISCVYDSGVPVFHQSRIAQNDVIIDNEKGGFGDLMITHTNEGTPSLENGELILQSENSTDIGLYHDIVNNGETQDIDLLYD